MEPNYISLLSWQLAYNHSLACCSVMAHGQNPEWLWNETQLSPAPLESSLVEPVFSVKWAMHPWAVRTELRSVYLQWVTNPCWLVGYLGFPFMWRNLTKSAAAASEWSGNSLSDPLCSFSWLEISHGLGAPTVYVGLATLFFVDCVYGFYERN